MRDGPLVVTPWYPSPSHPFHGVFVRDTVEALCATGLRPLVIHVLNVSPEQAGPPERATEGGIEILKLRVPIAPGTSRPESAKLQRDALREHAAHELSNASVVHAHVGLPTGWAVAASVPEHTRLLVTKHATYLRDELLTQESRDAYVEMLKRAAVLLAVTEQEARSLRRLFPRYGSRISVCGNPVRTRSLAPRESVPASLDRWLYVGSLIPRKGVLRLLEAFASWAAERPGRLVHLTLAGDGPAEAQLRERTASLGLQDKVTFAGARSPDEIGDLLRQHDVLVHLSRYETFGLTVVESAITGTPVLVTRCGGPEETLTEAVAEGLAQFVPPGEDVGNVITSMHALERSAASADVEAVRTNLLARFGSDAVGQRLAHLLSRGDLASPLKNDGPTIIVVDLSPRTRGRVDTIVSTAVHEGLSVCLVTDRAGEALSWDPRIDVVDVSQSARWDPHHLPETALRGLAALAFGLPQRLLLLPTAQSGWIARIMRASQLRLARYRRSYDAYVDRVRDAVFWPLLYSLIDPWSVAARRHDAVGRQTASAPIGAIVAPDIDARPMTWRILRDHPGTPVLIDPRADDLRALAATEAG